LRRTVITIAKTPKKSLFLENDIEAIESKTRIHSSTFPRSAISQMPGDDKQITKNSADFLVPFHNK
jgi:hypothetical protein